MSTETVENTLEPLDSLSYAAGTDIGKRREENQDSFGVIEAPTYRFYIVADGMGGAKGGAVASGRTIEVLKESLADKTEINEEVLSEAVSEANAEVFGAASKDASLTGMGTTVVGLAFTDTRLYVVNVGDSRAYRIRNNEAVQLTEDHTLVTELLRSGAISDDQAENHPTSHMLTRSLGPTPEVEIDCWLCEEGPQQGDQYLLCSDGLYNLVSSSEFLEILKAFSPEAAIQELIDLANERGGSDNITIILIEISDTFPVAAAEEPLAEEPLAEERLAEEQKNVDDTAELDFKNGAPPLESEDKEPIFSDSGEIKENLSFERAKEKFAQNIEASEEDEDQAREDTEGTPLEREKLGSTVKKIGNNQVLRYGTAVAAALLVGFLLEDIWRSVQKPFQQSAPEQIATAPELETLLTGPEIAEVNVERVPIQTANPAPVEESDQVASVVESPETKEVGDILVELQRLGHRGLSMEEVGSLSRRKNSLRNRLADLDYRISSFEQPFSGQAGEALNEASRRSEILKAELERVRSDIDAATRKLAVAHGRKRRLEVTDPVNLGSDMAALSETVRIKKEEFERATWDYLQEAEVLRYDTANLEQEERVAAAIRLRRLKMEELSSAVTKAVDEEVIAADQVIIDLTLKRDRIESEIDSLRQDVEYFRVLMGQDPNAKEAVVRRLETERAVAQAELRELERLLPESQEIR